MRNTTRHSALLLFLLLASCEAKDEKGTYKETYHLCNHLYLEQYTVFGQSAFGTDLMGDYLTDSTDFRFYVGTSDVSGSFLSYNCHGDSIVVTRQPGSMAESKPIAPRIDTYSIYQLKNLHNISNKKIPSLSAFKGR